MGLRYGRISLDLDALTVR